MTTRGLILYGPPGSGKSSVANALASTIDDAWTYRLLRSGDVTSGYRSFTQGQTVIWAGSKYGYRYGIDLQGFAAGPTDGTALIQLGEPTAVEAVRRLDISWRAIYLWCPRDVAAERFRNRGDIVKERLESWDRTPPIVADLAVDTSSSELHEVVSQAVEMIKATPR